MSEFQCYRFECVDGYLDNKQRSALRAISSRAEITANSFQVGYHYSGLKAGPADVMLNNFDIGLYYADWGNIDVYIKLPSGTIPDAFLPKSDINIDVVNTQSWQLLIFSIEEYEDYFTEDDTNDFFPHLALLRAELMQGDWRLIYLMWLRALHLKQQPAPIPLLHLDFQQLTDPQRAIGKLFDVPFESVTALSLVLADHPSHSVLQTRLEVTTWLNQLTDLQKNQLLTTLFEQNQLSLSQALAMTRQAQAAAQAVYVHWLEPEILAPYLALAAQQYMQEQALAQAKKFAAEQVEKAQQLTQIYQERDAIWQMAEQQAARFCASGYDNAADYLQQLAGAYRFNAEQAEFDRRFKLFVARHQGKKALLRRLAIMSW
ncbi:hypothetical protein EOE67_01660 [Rheinheimera riviphila]|uniref:Uncharacterized protein n=1 Tax=Rheinheimera riviphila TaxID=1834037 RepID=A0A437R579_9GAMM|nr:hypothetical protein [Rheinheimera riviphila]RVU41924.1 hypothetical protein EOE67_01660 [Rheinheimera riviphila]